MQTIPCLYTKHKTKKRKTWNDGFLKLALGGTSCSLYSDNAASGSDGFLESLCLPPASIQQILKGESTELEFESFLATVEHHQPSHASAPSTKGTSSTASSSMAGSALVAKIPKFKPPARVVKPIEEPKASISSSARMSATGRQFGAYAVENDELDSIWGENENEGSSRNNPEPVVRLNDNGFGSRLASRDGGLHQQVVPNPNGLNPQDSAVVSGSAFSAFPGNELSLQRRIATFGDDDFGALSSQQEEPERRQASLTAATTSSGSSSSATSTTAAAGTGTRAGAPCLWGGDFEEDEYDNNNTDTWNNTTGTGGGGRSISTRDDGNNIWNASTASGSSTAAATARSRPPAAAVAPTTTILPQQQRDSIMPPLQSLTSGSTSKECNTNFPFTNHRMNGQHARRSGDVETDAHTQQVDESNHHRIAEDQYKRRRTNNSIDDDDDDDGDNNICDTNQQQRQPLSSCSTSTSTQNIHSCSSSSSSSSSARSQRQQNNHGKPTAVVPGTMTSLFGSPHVGNDLHYAEDNDEDAGGGGYNHQQDYQRQLNNNDAVGSVVDYVDEREQHSIILGDTINSTTGTANNGDHDYGDDHYNDDDDDDDDDVYEANAFYADVVGCGAPPVLTATTNIRDDENFILQLDPSLHTKIAVAGSVYDGPAITAGGDHQSLVSHSSSSSNSSSSIWDF